MIVLIQFNPPENPVHVSYTIIDRPETKENAISVPVKKLKTMMYELGHNKIDILKMDIEGAEYQVIEDMIVSKIYPTQILVKFHHRFLNVGLQKTKNSINSLKRAGYSLFRYPIPKRNFVLFLNPRFKFPIPDL